MPLRRHLLRYAGASVIASALPRSAFAADYPARAARIIVVANRVRDEADLAVIVAGVGDDHELAVVPDDAVIAESDREGVAAIDLDPDAPGVRALVDLADRLSGIAATA